MSIGMTSPGAVSGTQDTVTGDQVNPIQTSFTSPPPLQHIQLIPTSRRNCNSACRTEHLVSIGERDIRITRKLVLWRFDVVIICH